MSSTFNRGLLVFIAVVVLVFVCPTPIPDWHKSPGRWDYKYKHHEWDYWEKDFIEQGRNALISQLLKKYFNSTIPRLLDVGCGYGMQLDYLPRKWETYYTGIDFSPEAIHEAKRKHAVRFKRAKFANISVEAFVAGHQRYDGIIFNEVLYYVNLTDVLPRYGSYLSSDGYIITSNYLGFGAKKENVDLQGELVKYYQLVDQVVLSRPSDGLTFHISSFRPKAKPVG
jgi:SAM-dependent methyltransferase